MAESDYGEIREAVARLCAGFPGSYWRELDAAMAYPQAFVAALTESGFLSVLIPEAYGGAGLPLGAAAAILEEVQRQGCNGAACHAQMYVMGTLLRHGSDAQKARWLPQIASGELRLQAFGVTEPTSRHRHPVAADHRAPRGRPLHRQRPEDLDQPRAEHSDLMMLLARTTPRDEVAASAARALRLPRRHAARRAGTA